MLIRRIQFVNSPVLGNTELDFTNEKGEAVKTILIAGDNGAGKTYLLETIFNWTKWELDTIRRDEKLIVDFQFSANEINLLQSSDYWNSSLNLSSSTVFSVEVDYSLPSDWKQFQIYTSNIDKLENQLPGYVFSSQIGREICKAVFSEVEINFSPKELKNVTSLEVDRKNLVSYKSGTDLATQIKQLLIDIESSDALEFANWARENVKQEINEAKLDIRLNRFRQAFSYMFPAKRLKGVETENYAKQIVFEENGRKTSIEKLSSGEKQIVFRGGFLLKDQNSLKSSIVLIDEPEISLHPSWQIKITEFFKRLLSDADGDQQSQLIISTHSPFIVHNASRLGDKVIVLKKTSDGNSIVLDTPVFYSWSSEQVVKDAFSLEGLFYDVRVTVFVEGETDEQYFATCVDLFQDKSDGIEFKWIGRIDEKGNTEFSGDTALNQAKSFFCANKDHLRNTVVLLYDSDTSKPDFQDGKLHVRTMSLNEDNSIFKIGVENLLAIDQIGELKEFYKERERRDNYNAISIIRELDKKKLANYVCNDLDLDKRKLVLNKIWSEIVKLKTEFLK